MDKLLWQQRQRRQGAKPLSFTSDYRSPAMRLRAHNRQVNKTWYPVLQARYRSMAGLARWEPSRIDIRDAFCPALVDGLAIRAAIEDSDWTAEEQAAEIEAQAQAMDERWDDTVPAIAYRVGLGLMNPADIDNRRGE